MAGKKVKFDPTANPFPIVRGSYVVIDELCRCGRARSEHAPRFAFGHGPCAASGCAQFTWKGDVTDGRRCPHCERNASPNGVTCGASQCQELEFKANAARAKGKHGAKPAK